jgi:hypothetical protein
MSFIELKQNFGPIPSVTNFDSLSNTMLVMAHSQFNRPNTWYSEPGNKYWYKEFEEVFKKVCQQVNTKLADDCPNKEKAFTIQTAGLVPASLPKFIGHTWKIRLMTLS